MNDKSILETPKVNIASMLPFGVSLRPLLNDSCLSDGDLNYILKSRGVFNGSADKKNTIPLIVTMILSPREFEMMQEKQKTREDNPKHRNSVIKSTGNFTLYPQMRDYEVDITKIQNENENIKILTPMTFAAINENHQELSYKISRIDLTRDWVRPESTHTGKVVLRNNLNNNVIEICNEHTSPETDSINKQVIKGVVTHLHKKNITVDETIKTISAKNFSNRDRFNFMLQLACDSADGSLTFVGVKDVELGPDSENPPKNPNSIFQENVKKIIVNGDALERNSLLTDDTDKDHLLLRSIEAKYNFNYNGLKGSCVLQYGFMHFFRNQNTSQDFQVALVYLNALSGNRTVLNNFVLNTFDVLKKEKYDCFKPPMNGKD